MGHIYRPRRVWKPALSVFIVMPSKFNRDFALVALHVLDLRPNILAWIQIRAIPGRAILDKEFDAV